MGMYSKKVFYQHFRWRIFWYQKLRQVIGPMTTTLSGISGKNNNTGAVKMLEKRLNLFLIFYSNNILLIVFEF